MARRKTITDALYDLAIGESRVFFFDVKPETIRTIAWRLKKDEGREYQCRSTPVGYQVWRVA
jgi:hypothetical protein